MNRIHNIADDVVSLNVDQKLSNHDLNGHSGYESTQTPIETLTVEQDLVSCIAKPFKDEDGATSDLLGKSIENPEASVPSESNGIEFSNAAIKMAGDISANAEPASQPQRVFTKIEQQLKKKAELARRLL